MTLGYATESRVRRMEQYLIDTDAISKKDFNKKHKKNQKKNKKEKYADLEKKIYQLMKKGATPLEIANYLNLRRDFVYKRQQNIFKVYNISKDDLSSFRKNRKTNYDFVRTQAKRENDLDKNSISFRQQFFDLVKDEIKYGNEIEKTDVEILGRALMQSDKFLSNENLKLIIMNYIKLGTYVEVNRLINGYLIMYGDTKFAEPLRGFRDYAAKKLLLPKKEKDNDEAELE